MDSKIICAHLDVLIKLSEVDDIRKDWEAHKYEANIKDRQFELGYLAGILSGQGVAHGYLSAVKAMAQTLNV